MGEGVGFTVVVIVDRYGDGYLGVGVNAGKSITPVSGSFTLGWIGDPFDDYYPDPRTTSSFIEGLSMNASIGVVGGGGITFSPLANGSVLAYESGAFTPQAGVSIVITGKIIDKR
jgi:hypothetical protein